MVQLIKSAERHHASHGWLNSYFLFSFADYYDPSNMQFGPLRVFNDDYIAPKSGFPMHPHSEMEIITIVLKGEISHKDSLGNEKTIKAGEVQRMTAGTGITHSEENKAEEELHLYQLWFLPNRNGLQPSYEQKTINFLESDNELIPLATGQKVLDDVIYMNTNSTVYYANLKEDKEIDYKTFEIRKVLIYVTEGHMFVNGIELMSNDQLRLEKQQMVKISASKNSSFILIDLPAVEANY
ncbi:pirin family protein [Adhaeribacter sp. BT258]|uniref:Pirin family protein n=1 Tax=Adhaeribacter terrigena TaxID=2793070 RepID=A0ABS1C1S5_9BACT|nr:pirin-like bicupin family protein [Adhaeribacter terrigena]MBK0403131.1 pirin family protein [Adhaeribacter terrigena]